MSASSLADVRAARGGLDGGEGSPEEGTSGIPLCPVGARSGVVKALQHGRRVYDVAASEDIRSAQDSLAVAMTATTISTIVGFHWRHFDLGPRFRWKR